ncbi:MAG: alkaline phosphatase family protein [Alphaproteobacteria bacterium]|nr:alkaline phosphatase family protein [Alphaproteobacteria bacterium]
MAILERLQKMQDARGKNRLVIVLDGMGVAVMHKFLDKNGFFSTHLADVEQAIIPATTVAATTAYRTGKMPWQTGFIGWAQYFSETDEVIEVFLNKNYYTGEVSKMPQHTNRLPCKTVVEEMVANGRKAFEVMPDFVPSGYAKFDDWLNRVVELCNQETDAYIYAYWFEPDMVLHEFGSKSPKVPKLLREMEQKIEKALQEIHNKTDVLITADHGHIDVKYLFVEDYPDVAESLLHPISLEGRCVSLFVKPEYVGQFPQIFNKHFGEHFKLITKAEFEKNYLHAEKPVCFIGDYVAMAMDEFELKQKHGQHLLKSNHAGFTKDELEIPVIKISVS